MIDIGNRLIKLFLEFAYEHEIYTTTGPNKTSLKVGIVHNHRLVNALYTFFPSEDAYKFGAVLSEVEPDQQSEFSMRILSSEAILGLTERIVDGGKFAVLGGRNHLQNTTDSQIRDLYKEDVIAIKAYIDIHNGI